MERNYHTWFVVCVILLLMIGGLLATDLYSRIEDEKHRQRVVDEMLKGILNTEIERVKVFTDYIKDLQSDETKSVYHQIYHANNAQLKMMNLVVQENQLLARLIAGKK